MIILFWIACFIIFYAFAGYGLLLYCLVRLKRVFFKRKTQPFLSPLPSVTLLVAAYNEEDFITDKIHNCLELDYDSGKLQIMFVTDGSTDRTPEMIKQFPELELIHTTERSGKMAAIERAIPFAKGEIIVFTDANTFLNKESIKAMVRHYGDPKVGAVAGEKRILADPRADASSAGEGFYWRYESMLKKWDYELYSNVGAAGELFSIRKALYQPVERDTIIDDHMIAMRIAEEGFIIAYEPSAYALETGSENSAEELKRKIRIAAGGIQSIFRLKKAANPFINPILTFQYLSHRVLRWAFTPSLMIFILVANIWIVVSHPALILYKVILVAQLLFYAAALAGWMLEKKAIKAKLLFIPYYFALMNYAALAGALRYFKGTQSAAWDKSLRKK